MIAFEVSDMTCGHCVGTITKALKAADPRALVAVDLAKRRVEIEPANADAQQLSDAIREASYTPVAVGATSVPTARSGCCCG